MRIPIFLVGTAAASLIWATLFAMVGWLFGETALLVLGHIRRYDDMIAGLLVVGVVLVFVVLVRRRRNSALLAGTEQTPTTPRPSEPESEV